MAPETAKTQTLQCSEDSASQAAYDPNIIYFYPQSIQTARIPGAEMARQLQVDVNIIDSQKFAREHPFLHLIHSSSNLLTTSQMKSEVVNLLARKRSLVLQLVELETRYDSLRSLLREDEGDDEADAFCQANYGVGDLQSANGELAFAYMDLTFKPHTFPGLSGVEY